jgi:site-specific DNA recombinase
MTYRGCSANYANRQEQVPLPRLSQTGEAYCGTGPARTISTGRLISRLTSEMMREEVLAVFIEEYTAETRRLDNASITGLPKREAELALVDASLDTIKTAILKGVDASIIVAELEQLRDPQKRLTAEIEAAAVLMPSQRCYTWTSPACTGKR